ncbi:MAG: hypothetical protein EP344_05820 [Bacteroidetes bacterium]|nr:MAG: hypothetical protein EP344_05820 [Bacteroidota bacterium]
MLYDRNREFAILVLLFIVAPGVYFFISGENHLAPPFRSYLVSAQVILGLVLSIVFWTRHKKGKEG